MSGLGRFQPFDTIEPPFVDDQQLRTAVNAESFGEGFIGQGSRQIGDELGGRAIKHPVTEGAGFETDGLDEMTLSNSLRNNHTMHIISKP